MAYLSTPPVCAYPASGLGKKNSYFFDSSTLRLFDVYRGYIALRQCKLLIVCLYRGGIVSSAGNAASSTSPTACRLDAATFSSVSYCVCQNREV